MNIMKRNIFRYLSAAVVLLLSASCSEDFIADPYQSGDKTTVTFSLGLENSSQTRAIDPDYDADPTISDGTRATTLIYALYTADGQPLTIDGESQIRMTGTHFPVSLTLNLVKGMTYKVVFWAQSETGDTYYDTSDLKNIEIRYEDNDDDHSGQLNNDEARDAFCKSVELTVSRSDATSSQEIILKRPFAQINVGIAKAAWEIMQNSNMNITESAISILGVGRKFNLVDNAVVSPDDVGGNTQGYTTANYAKAVIPHNMQLGGQQIKNPYLEVDTDGNGEKEQYVWVSMGYILPPSIDQSATVDITSMAFYYDTDTSYEPQALPMTNVPVRSNYRTNILFSEETLTGQARIILDVNAKYDDNDYWSDNGKTWNGEIADGVSVKSYRGVPSADLPQGKKSHYNLFWLDFHVSNGKGLMWISNRSNGVPFEYSDIPVWKDADGEDTTYAPFLDEDGKPSLDKYKAAIFDIIKGHGLLSGGANANNYNKLDEEKNLVMPWTFDDSSIILTNDIDFSKYEDVVGEGLRWVPISSQMYYYESKTQSPPPTTYAFKGEIDGCGHTISHMHVANQKHDSEDTWWKVKGNAGFVSLAREWATIKNVQLYDLTIEGDWNVGGFVGYYGMKGQSPGLRIENCSIDSSTIIGYSDENNPDNDANVGGFVGSTGGSNNVILTNCHISNSTIKSGFIVGGMIGYSRNADHTVTNCSMSDVLMILDEYNTGGASINNKYPERSTTEPDCYLYGQNRTLTTINTTCTNITLNVFQSGTKKSTAYPNGNGFSEIKNMPLDLFPKLDGQYGTKLTLDSHITGRPSYFDDSYAYGLFIDVSKAPGEDWKENAQNNGYTLIGSRNEPLYSLNIIPDVNGKTTYGIGITGDKGTVTVENLIINGEPSVETGILLDNAKDVKLTNLAVYDVKYTIQDNEVPDGATLTVEKCDLRGITEYGADYQSVTFTKTAFYKGSGTSENSGSGSCNPGCATSFTDCIFRDGFTFDTSNLPDGDKLTFSNCRYGKADDEQVLTEENVQEFLGIDADKCIFQ